MIPKSMYLACVVWAGLSCVSVFGQEKGAGDQPVAPHPQFSSVPQSGQGVHLGGEPNALQIYGSSYKSMLLTQAFVGGTEIRLLAIPSYSNTSFHFEYANTVQVPAYVVLGVEKTGVIEYRLNNCQFSLFKWPKG
jgi:hypothetical protein